MKAWFNRFFQRFFKSDNKQHGTTPVSYFAHIPKTAGTSFIVLLDRFYAADKIYPHQLWREVKHIDLSDNDHYDLFRGHFGGGGLEVLTQRAVEFFTLLRDPIALAQSTYQFVKRESNTKVHQLVEQQGINFAEFLSHPMTAPLVQNRMTRYLSFDFVDDPAAQEVFLSAETIEYLQSIIQKQGPGLTDEHRLKRAQNFIHHSRWFGLLERFDESLQLLCFEMHWPPMGETQKLNTFKKTKQLTPEEQQLIKQLNPQDNALYAYAAQVFEQRLMDMHQQLKPHQTHASQTINELLDISYQQHQSELISQALPNGLRYTFEQVLLGSQWHRREVMQPENEYFRWTGPASKAGIDFWLKRLNYQLTIRIINATSIELLNQLSITINGHAVSWQTTDTGLVRILTMQCPAGWIKENGLVRVVFSCQHMRSHAEAFDSDDERLVGVAVHWLKFSNET